MKAEYKSKKRGSTSFSECREGKRVWDFCNIVARESTGSRKKRNNSLINKIKISAVKLSLQMFWNIWLTNQRMQSKHHFDCTHSCIFFYRTINALSIRGCQRFNELTLLLLKQPAFKIAAAYLWSTSSKDVLWKLLQ